MNNISVQKADNQFVINQQALSEYAIVFEGCTPDPSIDSCIIPVKSRREIELLLLILGEEASVIMDEQARKQYPDVWDWLYGHTYSEIFEDLKLSYREEDEVLELIGRIPLPRNLEDSFIRLHAEDPEPEKINKDFVHKIHPECVLISKPFQCGTMLYFNGFNRSSEFNIDHNSDHLEGIIIFEVARQAGIATAHLVGMPFGGALVILKTTTHYQRFIETREPFLIRTIPAYKSRGGVGYCVYHMVQNGKTCATGYFTVIAYNSKDTYNKFRHSKILDKSSS